MVSKKFNYLNRRRYGDLGCHTDERERERERERENNLGFIISYILVDSLIYAMQGKVLQKYL